MRNQTVIIIVLIAGSFLNMGTIRQDEDPVLKTQTDPILYEKKQEELKDGEKGPALVTFIYYFRRLFRLDPPVEEDNKSELKAAHDVIPQAGDPIPEDLSGLEEGEKPMSWWEEEPVEELAQETP